MRVVMSPRAHSLSGGVIPALVRALAGGVDEMEPTPAIIPALPPRSLTFAEVHAVREALVGGPLPRQVTRSFVRLAGPVGYVCVGHSVGPRGQTVVAVDDHVGLICDSPLRGPNDDRLGPRFPRTDEVYVPEIVRDRLSNGLSVTISVATVAGVRTDGELTPWEREMVTSMDIGVASAELVPVAIIAAHLGLHLAAAVVLQD